jgi:hypothetical protein
VVSKYACGIKIEQRFNSLWNIPTDSYGKYEEIFIKKHLVSPHPL